MFQIKQDKNLRKIPLSNGNYLPDKEFKVTVIKMQCYILFYFSVFFFFFNLVCFRALKREMIDCCC